MEASRSGNIVDHVPDEQHGTELNNSTRTKFINNRMAFMIFLAYGIGLAGRICESQALRDFETLFRASVRIALHEKIKTEDPGATESC
ncbi:hypothetical protein T01_7092 [Trichinella spiralis]|uniref:Uncharacterized protein n=1 Tax=Trichinella spiralis TaxID=6334 RepID=A0A0V1BIS4_TRISP|nr:hypothetical protein T01_7092 [Trichinella spiralis]